VPGDECDETFPSPGHLTPTLAILTGGNVSTIRERAFFALLSMLFLLTALSSHAAELQQPSKQEASEEELVKQTQNPSPVAVSEMRAIDVSTISPRTDFPCPFALSLSKGHSRS
jgi:hypothetical protein